MSEEVGTPAVTAVEDSEATASDLSHGAEDTNGSPVSTAATESRQRHGEAGLGGVGGAQPDQARPPSRHGTHGTSDPGPPGRSAPAANILSTPGVSH